MMAAELGAGKQARVPKTKIVAKALRPGKLKINGSVKAHVSEEQVMTPIMEATITAQDTGQYRAVEQQVVSGGLLTNGPIIFSSDSALFYVSKDNAVAVYNVQNGEMVQNFSIPRRAGGGRTAIKAIVADPGLEPEMAHRVYTFSADLKVRLWDADSGTLLQTWELPMLVTLAAADPSKAGRFYCALRRTARGEKSRFSVSRVDLGAEAEVTEVFRATNVLGLAVRGDGQWVAAYSRFRVHVAHVGGAGRAVQHMWRVSERVSALAFHPSEDAIAVGDWRGRISLWFCLDAQQAEDTEDRDVVRRAHHWHAHRVNAIAFGGEGTLMLSGGEEGVLVMWQLLTESRDFLPRLGSDIVGIAVSADQMYYGLTLRDNTVRVIEAVSRRLVSVLQGLKFAERGAGMARRTRGQQQLARGLDPDPFTTGLVVQPGTHALVLNGEPGFLQVFNHATDRHLASIEVAAYNRTGGSAHGAKPHVDLVQFSSDGSWMATVDSRRADAAHGLMRVTTSYLKFWRLDPADQTYKLATRIDAPHVGGVRALAFRPSGPRRTPQCVSTGRDGVFRVWELRDDSGSWACCDACGYRGLQPRAAAFSADGSALSVTFGGAVTLWSTTAECTLVGELVASASTPALAGVAFVGASQFVAAWSADRLDLWNLLTGSLWWTLAMHIHTAYAHPRSALLAVVAYQVPGSSTASVLVLSPETPEPRLALRHPHGVEAVALVPASSHPHAKPDPLEANSLVVLTTSGLLSVYGAVDTALPPQRFSNAPTVQSSVFASIFGSASIGGPIQPAPTPGPQVRSAMRMVRSSVRATYIDAPHHVLPSVTALFSQFAAENLPRVEEDRVDEDGDLDMAPEPSPLSEVVELEELGPDAATAFLASMRRSLAAN